MTMTTAEILAAIPTLPLAERLQVLEVAARTVADEIAHTTANGFMNGAATDPVPQPAALPDDGEDDDSLDDATWWQRYEQRRADLLKNVPPESLAHKLLGSARTSKHVPMTKAETRTVIEEEIMKKYGA